MVLHEQLLAVARAYCAHLGCDLRLASSRAFAEAKLLPNMAARVSSPTVRRADRALAWFSDHWPEGADWPAGVPRPSAAAERAPDHAAETSGEAA